jgi:hypothetical protein
MMGGEESALRRVHVKREKRCLGREKATEKRQLLRVC